MGDDVIMVSWHILILYANNANSLHRTWMASVKIKQQSNLISFCYIKHEIHAIFVEFNWTFQANFCKRELEKAIHKVKI